MESPALDQWDPVEPEAVQKVLGAFTDWCLCGGISIDLLTGSVTREHGDIDIGVYRSQLTECLGSIENGVVYLCDPPGSVVIWDGEDVADHVNDIWVASADRSAWIMQILVYTDIGDHVVFKRNRRLTWPKSSHTVKKDGYSVLNPLITLLYKASRSDFEDKDLQDISTLINSSPWDQR